MEGDEGYSIEFFIKNSKFFLSIDVERGVINGIYFLLEFCVWVASLLHQYLDWCNIFLSFYLFRDYVRSELESAYEGPMYLEPLSMNRFTTALIGKYYKKIKVVGRNQPALVSYKVVAYLLQ